MKVGDTETLDIGDVSHLQGCQWTISRPNDVVFVTTPQTYSTKVTIKAVNAFPATSPCVVQCKYYYLELDPTTGKYTYSRTGYKDWTIFVKEDGIGDGDDVNGNPNDYYVGDLLKSFSKEGAYMEFQVTSTNPLNRTCELSGISKSYTGEVTIPSNVNGFLVTKIKNSACLQCNFCKVNIPYTVKTIEEKGFRDCGNLKTVSIEYGLLSIGDYAFDHDIILESINLPNSIDEIGIFAFQGCRRLDNVLLPSKMETIKTLTFNGCHCLRSIGIPEGVKRIESWAFNGCKSLEKIILPSTLMYLGDNVFCNVKELVSLVDKPFATGQFHQDFFMLKLYVPFGTKELYENTVGWNSISTNRIIEMERLDTSINQITINIDDESLWTLTGVKLPKSSRTYGRLKGIYIKKGRKYLIK